MLILAGWFVLAETDWLARAGGRGGGGGGQIPMLEGGHLDLDGGELESLLTVELLEGEEDTVEVKMAGNTFQQKTRVRSQTSRRWRERGSGRSWPGGEEGAASDILVAAWYERGLEKKFIKFIIPVDVTIIA